MKNTSALKTALLLGLFGALIIAYFGPCDNKIAKCLGGNSILATRTFAHLSIPSILALFVLLFLSNNIFVKWFKFAISWIFLSLFFISATPEYGGGFLDPDREQVSIWMSSLFLIISLILIVIWRIKEKKSLK